ncbi:MAG: acyltransferase family protein [Pseudomonadota bacterium]
MGVIRLFLALVVVVDHWRTIVLPPFDLPLEDQFKLGFNAGYAVLFFYVISGYLITCSLSTKGPADFYQKRFVRLFSLYWPVVLLVFILFPDVWQRFLAADALDKFTGLFLIGMDWRVAFATYPTPYFGAAIGTLHQAWTLGAELLFYLVAPLLMRTWRIGAALLVASFGLRLCFVLQDGTDLQPVWTYHFVGTTFGFFMLGHLACVFRKHLCNRFVGAAALLASVASMAWGAYVSFDTPRFWISVVFFTLALPGIFEMTRNVSWMNTLGDLSYPVYLTHMAVMSLAAPWVLQVTAPTTLDRGYLSIAVFAALALLGAILVHRLLEMPTAILMRRAMRRPVPAE